ncbi:MAG TPA: hypothetical protein VGO52_13975 [Hyphomonadaceae bacterium]|jgi:hypothetical protein|nr:hypothetical protein [Hyphomonadaceae bacterium]
MSKNGAGGAATIIHSPCFISHSYADRNLRPALRALPRDVEPVIFPPIKVSPEEFVSDSLMKAIRACKSILVLDGPTSPRSFWVAFEKDLAARARMPMFFYDASAGAIVQRSVQPPKLAIFPSYIHADIETVRHVCDYLEQQRSFDPARLMSEHLYAGASVVDEVSSYMSDALNVGGYVISFENDASKSLKLDRKIADGIVQNRVLRVWIGDPKDRPAPRRKLFGPKEVPMLALMKPTRPEADDFYRPELNNNRLDDLVVQLIALAYKNNDIT